MCDNSSLSGMQSTDVMKKQIIYSEPSRRMPGNKNQYEWESENLSQQKYHEKIYYEKYHGY